MNKNDPEAERLRLLGLYGRLTTEQLQQLARDAAELTDIARECLEAEQNRRGGEGQEEIRFVASEAGEFAPLETIRRFRDLPEALLAKGCLESAGIDAFLADDNMVRMDWFISNFIGGIKLRVRPGEAAAANELLDQPIPESFEVQGIGNYQQPQCPHCLSLDTTFDELNKPVAYSSAYLGLPVPLHRKFWKCLVCGQEWKDEGAGESG